MEKFQELRESAKNKLNIADHMLTMTYPLVQDPKLLLAVMENIFLAMSYAMSSVLYYERLFKKIPPFQENFSSKFNMFREKIAGKHKIQSEHLILLKDLRDMLLSHRASPVEFVRKDRFVICSNDYRMQTVSAEEIKEYLNKAKLFIQDTANIVATNEAIFSR